MNKKLYSQILTEIKTLVDNLNAYNNVDASVSDATLENIASVIRMTNDHLERQFVQNSCDEVDSKLHDLTSMPN